MRRPLALVSLLAALAFSCAPSKNTGDWTDDTDVPADVDAGPSVYSPTTLFVEPDDGYGAVLDAIKNAKTSIHLEVYMLTDTSVTDALVAAKKRGVEVKVALEQSPYGFAGANNAAYNSLRAAGVTCEWVKPLYSLVHTKMMIVDGASVFVMTLNLARAGFTSNREYGAIDTDPDDVAQAEAVFAADLAGVKPTVTGRLLVSPIDARAKLAALIDGATTSIDVEIETFSDNDIQSHFASALARGVTIRFVVPKTGRSIGMQDALQVLAGRGAKVMQIATPDIHAKLMVVDGNRAYIGSVNLTTASMDSNREVGLITDTPATVSRAGATFSADFAKGAPL